MTSPVPALLPRARPNAFNPFRDLRRPSTFYQTDDDEKFWKWVPRAAL